MTDERKIEISQDWIDGETKALEAPNEHHGDLRLWLRLLTCSTLVEGEVRRRLREEFDSTLPRFDLMAQLERMPSGMVLGDVSKRMMVSPGNITALVDRLTESGHISRTRLSTDRRVQTIALTEFGRAEFDKMAERHADWVSELFGSLTEKDRTGIMEALATLKRSVVSALRRDT